MFFQINVTPKSKKDTKSFECNTNDLHFTLVLGPFQPQTKITMEGFVNTTIQCYLNVKNISDKDLSVTVTKKPTEDRYIELDISHMTIQSSSNAMISIKWSPKEAGCWRDLIQLTDSRRIKYDVVIITTAKNSSKKCNKQKKSLPLLVHSSGQITNINKLPDKQKQILRNKSTSQDNFLSSNKHVEKEKLHSIQDKENIMNVDMSYKHTTESFEGKRDNASFPMKTSDEFLKFIDSSAFNLTDLNTDKRITDNKKDYTNQMQNISSNILEKIEIRRETYIKETTCSQDVSTIGITNKEIYDDSLSPQNKNISSEFSMLINNFALESANVLDSSSNQYKTSIKNISTSNNHIESYVETVSVQTDKNGTYDLSPMLSNNGTSDLNINNISRGSLYSSIKTRDLGLCQPKQLSPNFNSSSPIRTLKNEWNNTSCTGVLPSSSPIPFTMNSNVMQYSTKRTDAVTVKDVLEADLWVKDNDYDKRKSQVCRNINFESTGTERFLSKCENSPLNKTQTFNKEKSSGVCIEISPPKKAFYSKISSRKISPKKCGKLVKDKYTYDGIVKKKVHANVSARKNTNLSIPGVKITKLSLTNVTKPKNSQISDQPKENNLKFKNTDDLFTKFCNPDPFAACITEDPFLSSTMYYDEKWVHNQEITFKKWLNALLSPPEDLNTDVETSCVDIGKVWQSCKLMENSVLAETKEALSARYHTDLRLNTLRKAACAMYRRKEIVHVLSRTTVCVEKGILTIRLDRDLHRDIGLQKEMLELFLSYNPLWLRIGLETIYGENIPLHSNNDLVGLTRFILTRFFSDPSLKKNYPHAYHRKQQEMAFISQMNKFMLKKFLFLVYFLDYSKINKLIRHDPCLFHKKANIKDSRSILLAFSRGVLSGIGDITKVLRSYEYVVSYKQTYLDEFDYGLINIQNDLRDGVRLCRVMELITGRSDLTRQCRMPTISRLQKIYNVDLALKALLQCGYVLSGNIDAKSIADGHREKTLSLLWQIIYKYQAPRFEKAARCIQNWWRAVLWYVRTRNYVRIHKNNAACIIQRAWKIFLARRQLISLRKVHMDELQKKEKAVRFLQNQWRHSKRGIKDRKQFLNIRLATIKLQRWWRRIYNCREYIKDFQNIRKASLIIQRRWKAVRAMRTERIAYINMKNACIVIQTYWRTVMLMKCDRRRYLKLRNAVIFIQNRWKFRKVYCIVKKQQNVQLKAVHTIEVWWKNILMMRHERNNYLIMKDAVNTIKKWWATVKQQQKFQAEQRAAIIIQKYWRKTVVRNEYVKKQVAVMKIETWYKRIIVRRTFHNIILKMKNAAICIQHWWRNINTTQKQRKTYLKIHKAVLLLQKWWRSIILSRSIRQQYLSKRRACITIQTWWRMVKARQTYMYLLQKRNIAAITLQRKWRSTLMMRQDQRKYKELKSCVIKIQRQWRALQNAKQEYYKYCTLKSATIYIQRLFRANRISYITRQWYIRLQQSVIVVQSYWRMQLVRRRFITIRKAVLIIQTHWRAYNTAKTVRMNYELLKFTTIKIQRRYKSNKLTKKLTQEYNILRKITIYVQIRWRAKLLARAQRKELEMHHLAAKIIQKWWWHILFVKKCKFVNFKNGMAIQDLSEHDVRQMCCNIIVSVIKIQKWWRNIYQRRLDHRKKICAARMIQNWWITILKTKKRTLAATVIQSAWRGFQIRCKQSVHMSEVRQRLIAATKAASPSATLAYRCQKSINILKNCDKIGQLSMCLTSLGVLTRLLPTTCVTLCEHDLVETIYETYTASNRSLPWTTVCIQATSILITLAKFPPTKNYVCEARYALPTVKLLNDNLDRKELSLHVATLMWLLIDEEEYRKTLQTSSQSIWLLNVIYKKVIKKKDKLSYYSEILKKQSNLLPSRKPDWLISQNQLRVFTNIEHAITLIIQQLEIEEDLILNN